MSQIVIADVTVYDPSLSAERVVRFSTQGYVTGPSDTPANTYYEPRIIQPANISRNAFSANTTSGATTVGYGEMVLANPDGGLDSLLDCAFAGRSIVIKMGEATPAGVTWATVISGVMEQAEFSWSQLSIRVRDRQQDLTKPLSQNSYGGTNVLPAGVDGVAADLKGKRKPMVFGKVVGVAPPCVNTSKLIYQINDGALSAINAVYDRGVLLTAGAAYTSQADMEGTAPAAGYYRAWLAGGMVRLGASPAGTVTVDATQGAAASNRTVAQLCKAVMLSAGVSAGDISADDVTALDTACSAEAGVYIGHGSDQSAASVLDYLVNSIGAYWGCDRLGNFRLGRIVTPSAGAAVGAISGIEITKIERVSSNDAGAGVPAWKVTVAYGRVWSPENDLAGSVTAAEKARMAEEWRTSVSADATIKTAYLYSPEMRFETALMVEADAATEAARRLSLYKVRRDTLQASVRVDAALAAIIDIGKVVIVQIDRYGMEDGKPMLILGVASDMRNNNFELTLWG